MTRYDYSPLFRSTVGFDRLLHMLNSTADLSDTSGGYPPYDIEKLADDEYRVTIAVAGFGAEELDIEYRENSLTVSGKIAKAEAERAYLHRGIAGRAFKRTFHLADHMKVVGAHLENGLLQIELVRELPEQKRPRQIEIKTPDASTIGRKAKKVVESISKAA